MVAEAELSARITLRALPGLRDRSINRLIREHGSACDALRDGNALLAAGARGLPDDRTRSVTTAALRAIARNGMTVLMADAPDYPQRLAERLGSARPALLFAIGDTSLLDDVSIAVVGSRAMSEYGRTVAEDFSRSLSHEGLCIISGLALGIDAAAHEATLDAGGDTIAVLGNGVDVCYPPRNRALRSRIIEEGLLLSQFLPGQRPAQHHFPERNLILAALSDGVVVIEAGEKSGARITINHACDLNIDAMAVPGPIGRRESAGSNQLIREGVVCVTSVADILETIDGVDMKSRLHDQLTRRNERRPARVPMASNAYSPAAVAVCAALAAQAQHVDVIIERAGLPPHVTMSTLIELELAGAVRQHPGSRFELRAQPPA